MIKCSLQDRAGLEGISSSVSELFPQDSPMKSSCASHQLGMLLDLHRCPPVSNQTQTPLVASAKAGSVTALAANSPSRAIATPSSVL